MDMSIASTVPPELASEILETASAVFAQPELDRRLAERLEPICAVLPEHGIKIAPSIYPVRAKTPITLAELAAAYLVKTR